MSQTSLKSHESCSCSCTLCIRYTSLIACRVENCSGKSPCALEQIMKVGGVVGSVGEQRVLGLRDTGVDCRLRRLEFAV